jgi:hypothetical protein
VFAICGEPYFVVGDIPGLAIGPVHTVRLPAQSNDLSTAAGIAFLRSVTADQETVGNLANSAPRGLEALVLRDTLLASNQAVPRPISASGTWLARIAPPRPLRMRAHRLEVSVIMSIPSSIR